MWTALIKAVLGSLFGAAAGYAEDMRQRNDIRKAAVLEVEMDKTRKEIEDVLEAAKRRRRIINDPAYRDWVRDQIHSLTEY